MTLPVHRTTLARLRSLRPCGAPAYAAEPLCRCATSPHTVGSHPSRGATLLRGLALPLNCTGEHCSPLRSLTHWFRRGRRCGVAQRSMPQWGIEPHECASSAGWRRSLCAAKRRRPVQPIKRQHLPLTAQLLCITIYLTPWYYKVVEGRDSPCLTRRSCARGCWRGAS